jgi:hypothetical protein
MLSFTKHVLFVNVFNTVVVWGTRFGTSRLFGPSPSPDYITYPVIKRRDWYFSGLY